MIILDDIKHEVMVNYLYQQQCSHLWVSDGSGEIEGVLLRKAKSQYMACPPQLATSPFAGACVALNVSVRAFSSPPSSPLVGPLDVKNRKTLTAPRKCAMTVNSRVIKTFLQWTPDALDVPLMNGMRIQILPLVEDLARARKNQFSAFVASEGLLVVWDDDPLHLVQRAKAIESELMELVWRAGNQEDGIIDDMNEKRESHLAGDEAELEGGSVEKRPVHVINAVLVGMTLILVTSSLGAAWRQLAIQVLVDGNYIRLALVAVAPVQIFFTLFFGQVIVGCLAQIFGPVRQLTVNSKFYSARPPNRRLRGDILPHVTVQCPVYKEGLARVIAPTVRSIKQAITTYELQGGSANMFVNDDGLQLISEEDRRARIEFYADHGIGWVARPRHGEYGFQRRGKCESWRTCCVPARSPRLTGCIQSKRRPI